MRWIIGDVHGMLRPLRRLLEVVRDRDPRAQFLFVGDFVNRGPDSRGVIDLLLALQQEGTARFVRGNHDDIFDLVLNGTCYADNAAGGDRLAAFQWFMKYGLDSTFLSYGADFAYLQHLAQGPTDEKLNNLVSWVPQAHKDFVRQLPAVIEFDDLFIIHGKWPPDEFADTPGVAERLGSNTRLRHMLLWGRYTEDEIMRPKAWRRTAFVGHTPVSHYKFRRRPAAGQGFGQKPAGWDEGEEIPLFLPLAGTKMVMLDTAAALSVEGRLTAFCAEDGRFTQVSHYGKWIEDE